MAFTSPALPADKGALLASLRKEIVRIERRPPRHPAFRPTGRGEVDALLPGGGLPCGALTALCGGPASGKTALALSALATCTGKGELAAFLDGRGELYPPAAAALGVELPRVLWVRPPDPSTGLWAAEALLASSAFSVVVVDLALPAHLSTRESAMLRRIAAAAEKGGGAGVWLLPEEPPEVPAAVRLLVEAPDRAGVSRVRRLFARGAVDLPDAGAGAAARVRLLPSEGLRHAA